MNLKDLQNRWINVPKPLIIAGLCSRIRSTNDGNYKDFDPKVGESSRF